ncbi:heparinase II/III domain-containing protein [Erysipelothrix piscisicarius]|uniref:heparinase II/III domain-containing protein n=1 Tax=Erysipelothrix piscisicarius TaxID=2485784 RepID=UPI002F91F633
MGFGCAFHYVYEWVFRKWTFEHADNLHISTYFQGKPVLVDPGRLTYREDDPRRMHLKGMESHNTVILDGKPSAIPDTSWTYASFYKPLKNYVRHEGN